MRLVWWFLAFAALVMVPWLIWGAGWERDFSFERSVAWLQDFGPWAWVVALGLLISDLVLPMPSTVILSALGYLYGSLIGGALATFGMMLAGLLGYGIGRCMGESFAKRWLGENDYQSGKSWFENGGGWVVALSRALPILPEVVSCTAGLMRMPLRRFIGALACGCVPMGFLFAAIGHSGQDAPQWALALNLVIPALLWLVAFRLKKQNFSP